MLRVDFVDRYDKTHLVPFGEYVPLRAVLGRLLGAVARGIAESDVSAGLVPRALELTWPARGARASEQTTRTGVMVGVPICYELLFPDLVRRFVDDGAGVLLAITNDAWYGSTGAPHQFLAITAMRSAETGVWIVRAANTGISAIIDGRGRVRDGDIDIRDGIRDCRCPDCRCPGRIPPDTGLISTCDMVTCSCFACWGVYSGEMVIAARPARRPYRGPQRAREVSDE